MSGEREGLAEHFEAIGTWLEHYLGNYTFPANYAAPLYGQTHREVAKYVGPVIAEDLLDSPALADLLAARDRRARAEALRDAADNWPREVNAENLSREMATNLREIPPEYRVDQWLRDRADRIEVG